MGNSGKDSNKKALPGCLQNPFETLVEPLLLEILARLPRVQDQVQVAQSCKLFRKLVKQSAVLHVVDEETEGPELQEAISEKVMSRDRDSLRELRVVVDNVTIKDAVLREWIGSCNASLNVLQIKDDWFGRIRGPNLNLRLSYASTCPHLGELFLSGSCDVPLDMAAVRNVSWYKNLKQLTLERLTVPTSETLQHLIIACPILRTLHLPSLRGVRNVSITSKCLEDFRVNRLESWKCGDMQEPLEKFVSVILSTPNLRSAIISDVSELLDIQSRELQILSFSHMASCELRFQDLAKLRELAINVGCSRPGCRVPDRGYQRRWSAEELSSLISRTGDDLKHFSLSDPSKPPQSGPPSSEPLTDLFFKLSGVPGLQFSVEFLDRYGLESFWGSADHNQVEEWRDDGLFAKVEEVSLFFFDKARDKHADYVHFFLEVCPKLRYIQLEHQSNWPSFDGAFIRAVVALQREYPAIELDLELPQVLGVPF